MSALDSALDYAGRGWPVFPVHGILGDGGCSCGREDCAKPGKHPHVKDWRNAASTDPDVIRSWWARWPEANVAIVTGSRSGVVAIDLDDDDVGGEAYGWLLSDHGAPGSAGRPDGASIRTGRERGGWRLLLRIPPGAVIRKGVLAEGVEFMGDGGSAIMPPSRHVTGRRYTWADTIPPDGLPELAPAWVTLMAPRPAPTTSRAPVSPADFEGIGTPYGMAALRDEVELLAAAEKGTRNHRLNRAAFAVGSLAAAGHLDLEQAIAEVCRVAKAIGLGDEEIRATAKSGAEAGMRSPRTAA